jgi:hypothetical protein
MLLPRHYEPSSTSPARAGADALLALQLKIARRADEFARESPRQSALNLQYWLMAEAEVLRREFGLPPGRMVNDGRRYDPSSP